ncbi:hypothetical protein SCHPADRAFT_927010 [Schizopora paradoxa]|uniref:Uncharacterized protein n=1 Tax=Schizopora paradoxa TaxID=27342 RepID=A0A0H2RVW2_9AGAM|nr:hypothetical protein SCHPADRAFT_927010 [Schizopora paradoxa]
MGSKPKLSTSDKSIERIQRNRRGHISCLPVEILTEAFGYLLPESLAIDAYLDAFEAESDWYLHSKRKHDDIIRISHVCRSWRKICLSTPTFWNVVWVTDDDRFASRTEEFIRRSEKAPLEIAVCDDCSRVQRLGHTPGKFDEKNPFDGPLIHPLLNFVDRFPGVLQQLKQLRITSRFNPGQDFSSCFNKAAPSLESFAINVDTFGASDDEGSPPFLLPSQLFRGSTPSLRKVSLDGAEIAWTSSIFRNLTFLRIFREMDRREIDCVNLDGLLQIIEDCPVLVSLELGFAGPVVPMNNPNARDLVGLKINAPSLKNINLSGMMELAPVNLFLSCLQTSQLETLIVGHFDLSVLSIDEFLPRTLTFDPDSNLCNCINIDSDPRCEWVTVDQFTVDDLESKMTQDPKYFSLRWLRETEASFNRRIRCINDDDRIFDREEGDPDEYRMLLSTFLYRMCSSPEVTRAISFRGSDDVLDELPLEDIFKYLSNLYCVEVRYNLGFIEAETFMAFLALEAKKADYANLKKANRNRKGDIRIALPSVRMLIFDSVVFHTDGFKSLRSFLTHRKKQKAPILYVGLNYCQNVGRERVKMLKKLVPSVCLVNDAVSEKHGEEMDVPLSGYMVDEY